MSDIREDSLSASGDGTYHFDVPSHDDCFSNNAPESQIVTCMSGDGKVLFRVDRYNCLEGDLNPNGAYFLALDIEESGLPHAYFRFPFHMLSSIMVARGNTERVAVGRDFIVGSVNTDAVSNDPDDKNVTCNYHSNRHYGIFKVKPRNVNFKLYIGISCINREHYEHTPAHDALRYRGRYAINDDAECFVMGVMIEEVPNKFYL